MKVQSDWVIGAVIVAFSVWLYRIADDFPQGTDAFPKLLLGALILLAGMMFVQSLKRLRQTENVSEGKTQAAFLPAAVIFLACLAFVVLVPVIGFFVSGVLFSAGVMFYLGVRRLSTYFIAIGGVMLFIYFLFIMELRVPVPHGLLF
ncbi:MAG TPA: tripartite tricarboxylate transporter TctB family protein [Firmicutes bacterium]|nr:tripartite tricarboxylate transporter TctB family protein [Bacillota bacterium]